MSDPVEILKRSVSPEHPSEFQVTGLMIRYYHTCHRELWFHTHGIEPDRETRSMRRGTRVDQSSYKRSKNAKHYGPISPDIMQDGKILEVKPSSSMKNASKMQLGYYLWYLKHVCDIERDGVLAHPTEKKRQEITLDEELESEVENSIRGVYDIINKDSPPEFEEKEFCDTCAFQYFCWSGVKT